ncbi:MAG: phage holin family protein [Phycisphaerales bacterium]
MEDKRKIILLAVAGICIVGAGVLLYMQMGDSGPKPKPPPTIEEITKDPEMKKSWDQQQLQIQQNEKKHVPTQGS